MKYMNFNDQEMVIFVVMLANYVIYGSLKLENCYIRKKCHFIVNYSFSIFLQIYNLKVIYISLWIKLWIHLDSQGCRGYNMHIFQWRD